MIASPEIAKATAPATRGESLVPKIRRWLLFAFCLLLVCPIRVWTQKGTIDSTWVFALNYARAHGLVIGSDVVWTMGPLSVYLFPQAIGNNIPGALAFQAAVWVIMALVIADVFRAKTTNPGLFTFFIALSAPLYWFNYTGIENLLIAAVAILLTLYRWHGGRFRCIAALLLAAVVPLISFSAGVLGAGMLAGYLIDAVIGRRARVWEAALAIVAPAAVLGGSARLMLGSVSAVARFARATLEFAGGYTAAMSLPGAAADLAAAAAVVVLLGAFVWAGGNAALLRFFSAMFAIPLFAAFKHAFVRQDEHEVNFFCFVALAMAAVCVVGSFRSRRAVVSISTLAFGLIWTEYMLVQTNGTALLEASGFSSARMLVRAARTQQLHDDIDGAHRLEPAVRRVIGQAPVASLSTTYDGALADRLNLVLYPVIQRYAAYTPYLDRLNAAWVREKGPRFLVFDGSSIDDRQPWAETPAMWHEIYRWYRTRLLTGRELLLERQASARASNGAAAWAADCRLTPTGRLESLFFRIPEITLSGRRIVPAVLASPMPGNPPASLQEFAAFFDKPPERGTRDLTLPLAGPGADSYACQLQIPSPQD
jgi:hypothetical protein